ncbi:MAG: hypothetical protein CM15mP85_17910 [Rhodobacterales bacterium]|nr:MAG: hypothetical protein CM15mP85_17910 [Rhodobacterales bacterium]
MSYQIVTDMLNQLATQDEACPFWHEKIWDGPGDSVLRWNR